MLGYKNWKWYLLSYNPINSSSQSWVLTAYLEGNNVFISEFSWGTVNTTYYGFLRWNNTALIVSDMSQYITLYTLTRFDEWFYLYKLNYTSIKFNNVNNFIHNTNDGWGNAVTKWGTIIFGCQSSNSMIIENYGSEWTGICFWVGNWGQENITSFSTGDSGWFYNFQDEDVWNSRVCYVNLSGVLTVSSWRTLKHSIKNKICDEELFNRFLKINIVTFGYKYETTKNMENEKIKQRINNKRNKMHIGLIAEDVYEI